MWWREWAAAQSGGGGGGRERDWGGSDGSAAFRPVGSWVLSMSPSMSPAMGRWASLSPFMSMLRLTRLTRDVVSDVSDVVCARTFTVQHPWRSARMYACSHASLQRASVALALFSGRTSASTWCHASAPAASRDNLFLFGVFVAAIFLPGASLE